MKEVANCGGLPVVYIRRLIGSFGGILSGKRAWPRPNSFRFLSKVRDLAASLAIPSSAACRHAGDGGDRIGLLIVGLLKVGPLAGCFVIVVLLPIGK